MLRLKLLELQWVDKVAQYLELAAVEAALLHLASHELAGAYPGIDTLLEHCAAPALGLGPGHDAGCHRAFHAPVLHHRVLVAPEALLAGLALAQAGVGRAQQLVVVQGPHHLDAAVVGHLGHHGRQVAVHVVQVHHIGLEIVEHAGHRALDVAQTHNALQGFELGAKAAIEANLTGKVAGKLRLNVVGILHGIHTHIDAVGAQQPLGVECDHTIAATGIVELVDE